MSSECDRYCDAIRVLFARDQRYDFKTEGGKRSVSSILGEFCWTEKLCFARYVVPGYFGRDSHPIYLKFKYENNLNLSAIILVLLATTAAVS